MEGVGEGGGRLSFLIMTLGLLLSAVCLRTVVGQSGLKLRAAPLSGTIGAVWAGLG